MQGTVNQDRIPSCFLGVGYGLFRRRYQRANFMPPQGRRVPSLGEPVAPPLFLRGAASFPSKGLHRELANSGIGPVPQPHSTAGSDGLGEPADKALSLSEHGSRERPPIFTREKMAKEMNPPLSAPRILLGVLRAVPSYLKKSWMFHGEVGPVPPEWDCRR